jgi:ribose transport system substrate-binding protein
MKKWYLLLLSLTAALVLFMALSVLYESASSEETAPDGTVEIVLKSTEGPSMDFWSVVGQGIRDAAREFDIQVEISGARYEKDINRQINIMDNVIAKNPPLIILAATDYVRLVDAVEKAHEKGIPVITLDSGIDSDLPVSFVATDNVEAGIKAGEEMKRLLSAHDRKKLAIVSHIRETATAIEREKGVRYVLGDEDIIASVDCDVDDQIAYEMTMQLMENEELGGIVALNEVVTLGAARAVRDAGRKGEVLVVGFDNAVEELAFLEEGIIQATVVQRPYNMGYLSVKAAVDKLKGREIDPLVDTGSVLITKENMFERQYQELLFPFSGVK